MRFRRVLILLVVAFFLPSLCRGDADSPHKILATLNSLQLDTQHVYTVTSKDRVVIRKGDAVISLQDGKLAFFEPFDGRITGFAFTGIGHVLSLPRDPVEKQQLARFLGAPVLDQQFLSAYVRFTDDTGAELLEALRRGELTPAADDHFRVMWQTSLERLNISHSLRILAEKVSPSVPHFFHAGLDGAVTGPFDILLDPTRMDDFVLGQPRTIGSSTFYDVWASYSLPGSAAPLPAFDALRYRVDTVIHPDNSLDGITSIEFRALLGSQAFLGVQLSRTLKVVSVTGENGQELPYFQNQGLSQQEINFRGQDTLVVFLPKAPSANSNLTLTFRYAGNVIEDAGNGVLFVGARESWYPHFGDASEFANYELTFHWPRRLRLVATGTKSPEREDGDTRVATWTTELPVTHTGFNLGEYASSSLTSENHTIDVYANRHLEEFLRQRLAQEGEAVDAAPNPLMSKPPTGASVPAIPPSPANFLKQLAREVDSSIRFDEIYCGPFPFRSLQVSQIPGGFGQGWPGLLYLSTFSFLPEEAQARAGLSATGRSFFTDVVPFHEVAHQWWGNVVGWSSYRDQWIDESIAEYLALLFADSQKSSEHALNGWLDHYRKRLVTKMEGEDRPPADIGPISIGMRLSSSRSPDGYNAAIYAKGTWVIHMLREMLREPAAKNPDARFTTLLRTLVTKYARSALTTPDLQREVESVMAPRMALEGGHSMEWFFAQYVRGVGIPRYKVEFTSRGTDKGFQVHGKLLQSGVPHSFIAPVPLYGSNAAGRTFYLGTVTATGDETSFTFNSTIEPHKLLIDPRMTLLCIAE